MSPAFKKIDDLTHRLDFTLALQTIAFFGFAATLTALYVGGGPRPTAQLVIAVIAILAQALVCWTVYHVFSENKRAGRSAYELHAINHEYRDALSQLFSIYEAIRRKGQAPKVDELLLAERAVLDRVCRKIAVIFWIVTARKCVVTVKLLKRDSNTSSAFCFSWARSEYDPSRSDEPVQLFAVGTGENTGFDEALKMRPSVPSHFHGPDLPRLAALKRYSNKRDGWENIYRSTIIVPIRHVIGHNPSDTDNIGFLCVDSMSTNRFNNTSHVQLLAAFADQMYNFLSIMRSKYVLVSDTGSKEEGV